MVHPCRGTRTHSTMKLTRRIIVLRQWIEYIYQDFDSHHILHNWKYCPLQTACALQSTVREKNRVRTKYSSRAVNCLYYYSIQSKYKVLSYTALFPWFSTFVVEFKADGSAVTGGGRTNGTSATVRTDGVDATSASLIPTSINCWFRFSNERESVAIRAIGPASVSPSGWLYMKEMQRFLIQHQKYHYFLYIIHLQLHISLSALINMYCHYHYFILQLTCSCSNYNWIWYSYCSML